MKRFWVAIFVLFIAVNLTAGDYSTSVSRFLLFGGAARPNALGGAYTAVADDAATIGWNPAGLGAVKAFELSFMHMMYGEDIGFEYIASTIPMDFGTFGLNFIYLGMSPLSELSGGYTTGDSLDYYDMAFSLSFGKEFLNQFGFGVTGRYIKSGMGVKDTSNYFIASGYAFDVGLLARFEVLKFYQGAEKNLGIGAAVRNIGTGLTYISEKHKFPMNIKAGLFYKPIRYSEVVFDYNIYNDAPASINVGLELFPEWILSPRGGITLTEGNNKYTAGLGLKYSFGSFLFQMDYGFNTDNYFTTHMINIALRKFSASLAKFGIGEVMIRDIFPSMYKYYTKNSVAKVTIKNNTNIPIENIKVSMFVNKYMDFPSESQTISSISPGRSLVIELPAEFNNEILKITEDTPMQAQIQVNYVAEGKRAQLTTTSSFKLYNRYSMTWDNFDKLAAFVTPKDTPIKIFSRGIIQKFRDESIGNLPDSILKAAVIFNAVGATGLTYVLDPQSPYRQKGKTVEIVDQIQYPRDTLRFKTGDCDDCSVLFCALLENIGLNTAFVDVQDHIFMMFDTGVSEDEALMTFGNSDLYIIKDGTAWLPIETTMYNKGFTDAWLSAANTYKEADSKGIATIVDVKNAWETFYPVTLPDTSWEPELPPVSKINEYLTTDKRRFSTLGSKKVIDSLMEQLRMNPKDDEILNKLGATYGKFGDTVNAKKYILEAISINPRNAKYYNNLANVYFLDNKFDLALKNYKESIKLEPENANYRINLANLYSIMGQKSLAEKEMNKAEELLQSQ